MLGYRWDDTGGLEVVNGGILRTSTDYRTSIELSTGPLEISRTHFAGDIPAVVTGTAGVPDESF